MPKSTDIDQIVLTYLLEAFLPLGCFYTISSHELIHGLIYSILACDHSNVIGRRRGFILSASLVHTPFPFLIEMDQFMMTMMTYGRRSPLPSPLCYLDNLDDEGHHYRGDAVLER